MRGTGRSVSRVLEQGLVSVVLIAGVGAVIVAISTGQRPTDTERTAVTFKPSSEASARAPVLSAAAHLILVDSEESRASLVTSLGHEAAVRHALDEPPRMSWVVAAATDNEAAEIAAIALDQSVPGLADVELRITNLRTPPTITARR